jgi:hypothetical protein
MGYNARNDEIRDNVGCAAVGSTTRCAATVRRFNATLSGQRLCVVLAEDYRRAHIKTSLADYQLRQLRHGG